VPVNIITGISIFSKNVDDEIHAQKVGFSRGVW
jgi:hypothetical protein